MAETAADKIPQSEMLQMTAQMVSAYLGNNTVPASQIPELIRSVFSSLSNLDGGPAEVVSLTQKPAVNIKKSITPEFIVCLEDGKRLKMLKRHLRTTYNMTPDEYRAKWNLPPDYPMVAPNYAKQRSAFAKKIGLGRKARSTTRRASAR